MQACTTGQIRTFLGEDGEHFTLRRFSKGNCSSIEVSLECDGAGFRGTLDHSERDRLGDFLESEAKAGRIVFKGVSGARLVFEHDTLGEPFREGLKVLVEGLDDFPDYLGPFKIGRAHV